MKLIEKSMLSLKKKPSDNKKDNISTRDIMKNNIITSECKIKHRTGKRFKLDKDKCFRSGYVIPSSFKTNLASEINQISHLLIRRLDYFNLSDHQKQKYSKREFDNVVLVTSPEPSDGKTFTTMNLAFDLVMQEKVGVTIIDGDIHRPCIAQCVGISPSEPGLVDLFQDVNHHVADYLFNEEELPLSILTSGICTENAVEAFKNKNIIRDLIQEIIDLNKRRIVLIDSPPLLASIEASSLSEIVSNVLIVISAEKTKHESISMSLDVLGDNWKKVSFVFNKYQNKFDNTTNNHYSMYKKME